MRWLQDNPFGKILASIAGFFVLLALAMAIVWNLPVSVETAGPGKELAEAGETELAVQQLGDLGDYLVINQKPVFNESRQPEIDESDEDLEPDDTGIEVKGAPAVKLTGVVITPDSRFATLTPDDSDIEGVMAREGESLTGEFVGWRVASVKPRLVVLESRDGRSLEFELQVHDVKIEEPPPVPPASSVAQALAGGSGETTEEGEEPMSRAEQIRQRIAERREELRREQEAQQSRSGAQADTAKQPARPNDYQAAIRAMMQKKGKDQSSNDEKDG